MPVPSDFGANLKMDPKMVREISSTPGMAAEQPNLAADYGGPNQYIEVARWSPAERQVFYAVRAGYSNSNDIAAVTGLSSKVVDSVVPILVRKGAITQTTVVPESGVEPL